MSLPERARVVVIGGGVIGTSVAYHLAALGCPDVVLLEQGKLTSGTTWHAAGLIVTFGSTSETSTNLRQYTRDLYAELEAETGLATGLKQCGFIEVAADRGRLEEYRRVSAFNRLCGVDVQEISPGEVKELFPLARTDDILAGFYVADDGRANPVDVTMSLARGARLRGVTIVEGVRALRATTNKGTVTGVDTEQGHIEAEFVVNCAGMWARQLGAANGVSIPLQAAEHYYLITEPIAEVDPAWPVLEDPGAYGYFREEGGGLMLGLFETVCAPWHVDRIPDDFQFGQLPPDWERMTPYLEKAMGRIPIVFDRGVRTFFCGPESFTPDLSPIVGEAPELRNYFVAAGLNSIGILSGGGLGRVVAQWILDGRPDVDVTEMNIDRLHPYQANPEYRATRTVEALGQVYETHFPGRSMRSARGAKQSPLHDRLSAKRPFLRDVSGWEMPDWYGYDGTEPTLTWGKPGCFEQWAEEHRAAREGVILMDMSFMAKFAVEGPGAGAALGRLSAGAVDGKPGRITYTQWLNEAGTLEADLTVTKLDEDRFWVVASDTAHRHVLTRMRTHGVPAIDVTGGYAQLNVQGPRSRELLAQLTTADLSNEAFPFRTAREIDLGFARVLCVRITYLGELGYELYVPAEQAVHVYDRIVAAGDPVGLRHAGLKALASLRLEKAYRDYGHDIDNTDTVDEAGLGFAVSLNHDFIGRDAVIARRAAGPPARQLAQVFVRDPEPMLHHAEIVRRDGEPVGYIRAGSYGHTLGGAVGLAMLPADLDGEWTVEIADRVYPVLVGRQPLYDPTSARVRA